MTEYYRKRGSPYRVTVVSSGNRDPMLAGNILVKISYM